MIKVLLQLLAVTCCLGADLVLSGSGTTNPSKLFWKLMETIEERLSSPALMTYRAVGSSTGIQEFVAQVNHFGSAEIPMKDSERTALGAKTALHLPVVMGAIGIFHSIPTSDFRGAVNLTAPVLGRIFQRDIKVWDHPDILALNPTLQVPAGQAISVVHRRLGSSSTYLTTQYLSQNAPGWTLGFGATVAWPADTATVEGSEDMSTYIEANKYSIGYIDADHGHILKLQEVALKNKDGVYLLSSDADLGASAAATPAADGSWETFNIVNKAGPKTWPMVTFSYILVTKNLTSLGQVGHLLKAFLQLAMSEEGQAMSPEFGFVGIPSNVIAQNNAAIDSLLLDPAGKPYVFEGATMPVTGNGAFVISSKRRQFSDYQMDLNTAKIAALEANLAAVNLKFSREILEVHGSGTTNPSKLHWMYAQTLEEMLGRPMLISYRGVGSSTGQAEFIAGATDFAGSEIALSAAQRVGLKPHLHIPHVLGSVSIFHSIPNLTGLNLTAEVLAKIFQRDIKTWDHPKIIADNPNLKVPVDQPITVARRVLGSSSTFVVTSYLNKAAKEFWRLGAGSTITWPAESKACEGSAGMSLCLANTPYTIGYMETDHGVSLNLNEVGLKNKDGKFLTAQTAEIGAAASFVTIPESSDSWEAVDLLDQPGPKTWPLTLFSYILVPRDLTPMGVRGSLMKAYLEFALSDLGQSLVKQFGFVAVPDKVKMINQRGLDSLVISPRAQMFTFEINTAPIIGAGAQVFSVKRRRAFDVDIKDLQLQVKGLMDSVKALTAANTVLASKLAASGAAAATCEANCGKKITAEGQKACYCDKLCLKNNDCCGGKDSLKQFCPEAYAAGVATGCGSSGC